LIGPHAGNRFQVRTRLDARANDRQLARVFTRQRTRRDGADCRSANLSYRRRIYEREQLASLPLKSSTPA
jgi:hypothetical protein